MKKYDLAIIGAGPGGYVAAIRARQLGLSVALVEKDKPGGVCLNWGCIPSKSLIHQAELFSKLKESAKWGVKVDSSAFSYAKVQEESRKVAETLSRGVAGLIKKNGVDYLQGEAQFKDANTLTVDGKDAVSAKHIIIATGSRPRDVPGFAVDEKKVLTSTGILAMKELPKRMVILGGGAIGIEFAYVLNTFGVEVTVVELMPTILPLEDSDISSVVAKSLGAAGVKFLSSTKALSMSGGKELSVALESADGKKETVKTDAVLVSIGRVPCSDGIGLEKIGVKTERGYIITDGYGKTSLPSVYAIGDITTTPQLAHVASKEAEIAVEAIAGKKSARSSVDKDLVPSAVYCEPQVASFGPTEADFAKKGVKVKKMVFPYRGAGKSVAIAATDGMVKLLCDATTHEILACHIVGHNATELIHEMLLAKHAELLPEDVASLIHAHPTLSEAVMEAAKGLEGAAIHV